LNATHNPEDLRRVCTAISKRIRRRSLNDAFILPILLSREILIVLPISLSEKFSAWGSAENIAGLRIQTAVNGVNNFVEAMPA
jgi:hypothetical protein